MRHITKARLLAGATAIVGSMTANVAFAQAAVQDASVTANADHAAAAPEDGGQITPQSGQAAGGIVVVGNRYQATSLQMRSDNTVNVLSAQDLAHTAVHNVAEALGLLPGVNVIYTGAGFANGVDNASRAEGMFVSVRGLNAEYNVNLINGVDVAQGSPYTRGVQLSLLPPSGLQTVVLNKTSRADMDGDAVGGTVDFRTPSAFDYADRVRASITGGGRLESRARDYGRSGLGYNGAADGSIRFGPDEQFGLYVSGFYDIRRFANSLVGGIQEATCCDFGTDFAVQNADGSSATGLDPTKNLILTGANFGVSSGYTERYGGNASFDWRPDADTSFYARVSYAKAVTRQDSHLSQIVAQNKGTGSAANGQNGGGVALGNGTYAPILNNVSIRSWYETNPEIATLGTGQIGFEKHLGGLTIAPNIFYSWAENSRPDHIEVAVRTPNPGLPYGQSSLFNYAHGYPQPTLTADQSAALNNLAGLPASACCGAPELTPQTSKQQKAGGKIDFKYDFGNGTLRYVKFGGKAEESHRTLTNRDYTVSSFSGGPTFGDTGLIDGSYSPVFPGQSYSWSVPDINQKTLFDQFNQLGGATAATIDTCGSGSAIAAINSYNCNTQKAKEFVAATYIEASFVFGDLEVIPGVRYEHTEIYNTFWVTPNTDGVTGLGHFANNSTVYNEILPSVFLNYRPDSRAVYRASVWTSYVRPPFLYLGGGQNTSFSSSTGATTITQGNPDLKPVTALNFDASGEWDFGRGTHFMIGGFYKRLHNYIYDNGSGSGVVDTITGTLSTINQPRNGGSGKVYGIELMARQKLAMLRSPFDGLGVGGNFTRQWTKVDVLGDGTRMDRIQNAPNYLANAQLFFEKGPVTLDLNYSYSGSYVAEYDKLQKGASWDDVWVRPYGRLDLHAGYAVGERLKFDMSVSNLTGVESYWAHIGRRSLAVSDIVDSGTTYLLTATLKL